MKNRKSKYLSLFAAALIALGSLTGCSSEATDEVAAATSGLTAIDVEYSEEDMNADWDSETATNIALDGVSIAIDGEGASSNGSILTISAAGTYVLSGTLEDGQVIVDTGKDDLVRIVLSGAEINSSTGPAIYAMQSGKTIVTLADGTANKVSDGASYELPEGEDEPDAAIFSQDDLTFNGSGALTVKGNYNNGICTKDDLVITGGIITIASVNDGLRGRDSIAVCDGALVIDAGRDGLQSNNDEDTVKGWISIDGGSFDITSGNDALQAETILQVSDGDLSLNTGGGSVNASTDSSGSMRVSWGSWPTADAGTGILVSGGTIAIDSSDDAIHSNGEILIESGDITIASGDDWIHADASLAIDGGTIDITKSYEGLESASITVNGGIIDVVARDDGFNAAGGSDGSSQDGRPGENDFSADVSTYFIKITGGSITVYSDGDGIDSNGSLYIDGGTVLVNGPTTNGNGTMDYSGVCEITGGTVAAAGSSGMAQPPSDSSSQNTLAVYYSEVQAAGTLATLMDEIGQPLISFAPAKEYQSIVFSLPDLSEGSTYNLLTGGTNSGDPVDGLYIGGSVYGATVLTDVTISAAVTSISDDGSAASGTMGGKGGGTPPAGDIGGGTPPAGGKGEPGGHGGTPPSGSTPASGDVSSDAS